MVALSEIAEVRLGRQRSPKNHSGPQNRKYLRAANVGWHGLILDDVKEMNFSDAEMSVYRLDPGDILLNEASGSPTEVGKPAIWNGEIAECAFQNTLLRVRPHPIVDGRYLLHYLRRQAATSAFARGSRGAGISHLGREALASWPIPLPPLDEQRRIAAILDHVDRLRNKRNDVKLAFAELTSALFYELIGDPVANPKRWRTAPFGELAELMQYGPRFYNESYSHGGVRIVRITDLDQSGDLDFSSMPLMDVSDADLKKYVLQPGEMVFARTGATVGKLATIKEGDPPCIAGAYFIRVRFHDEVEPEVIAAAMRSRSIQSIIYAGSHQSAQQNFSGPGLRGLPMVVPPREVQHQLVSALASLRRQQDPGSRAAKDLDELFASLQSRAFNGEL